MFALKLIFNEPNMHEERIKKKIDCSATFKEVVECLKMQSKIVRNRSI
jgi:hypothetical protein